VKEEAHVSFPFIKGESWKRKINEIQAVKNTKSINSQIANFVFIVAIGWRPTRTLLFSEA